MPAPHSRRWRALADAFVGGSFAMLSALWVALGGAVGVALLPLLQGWLPVPVGMAIGGYVALTIAYHNATRELTGLRSVFDAADRRTPDMSFDRVRHSEVRLDQAQESAVDVWQLWFRNRQATHGQVVTAEQLTALVEFCDEDWHGLVQFVGQWAETRMPEHVGWTKLHDRWDLPPVMTWGKLLVAGQDDMVSTKGHWGEPGPTGELEWVEIQHRHVYGLSGENLHHRPQTADHSMYELPPAVARLRVTVIGLNAPERIFQFRVFRDELGALTDFVPL